MTRCFGLGKVKGGHKYEFFFIKFLDVLRYTGHIELNFFTFKKIINFMEFSKLGGPPPPYFGKLLRMTRCFNL